MNVYLVLWHLGGLHGYEKALAVALTLVPFVILAGVIGWRHRIDSADETDPDEY